VPCDEADAPVCPDEPTLPLADVSVELPCAVTVPWLGFVEADPAVDWPPSIEPCCVVPDCVLAVPRVSLLELEHAAIRAAAASAVMK
jgi:hypothetical protein